jgi:hypothetical protein
MTKAELRNYLKWQLKYGHKHLDDVASENFDDPIVTAAADRLLDERPFLTRDLELVLAWFYQLSPSRPQSMAAIPCALPLCEIEAFYRIYGVSEFLTTAEFCDYMVSLDRELIDYYLERDRASREK